MQHGVSRRPDTADRLARRALESHAFPVAVVRSLEGTSREKGVVAQGGGVSLSSSRTKIFFSLELRALVGFAPLWHHILFIFAWICMELCVVAVSLPTWFYAALICLEGLVG